jgi:hypothetical protein
MNYEYYKTKYRAISIKLDNEKDADILEYFDKWKEVGFGPKDTICYLIRERAALDALLLSAIPETEAQ